MSQNNSNVPSSLEDDEDAKLMELMGEPVKESKPATAAKPQTTEELFASLRTMYGKPKAASNEEAEKLLKLVTDNGFTYTLDNLVVYLRMIAKPEPEPRLKFPPSDAVVEEAAKLLKILPHNTTANDIDACMCMVYHKFKDVKKTKAKTK